MGRTGLSCSPEHKCKIGLANKGKKPKGYVRTEEHRQQLRDRMKGNNVGVKFTKESATAVMAKLTPDQRKERSQLMHTAKCLKKGGYSNFKAG